MNERAQSSLASVLAILVGGWIMLTPALTSVTGAALTNMLVVGGAIAFISLVQLFWVNVLPSWLTGLVSVWAFISAFTFDMSAAATWSLAAAAVVAFLLSIWDGVEISHVQHKRHLQT